jgi:hypothetical protein
MTVNIVLMRLRKRALPIVSLHQMMTDIPEEHVGRGFGACDRTQIGVVDRVAIERALAGISPGYRTSISSTTSMVLNIARLPHYGVAA